MKKFLLKFNELTLTILLEAIVGIIAIGLSCIGFAYGKPGWAIGVSTGTLVAMISTVMVFKGSDSAIKDSRPGLYISFYFLRMVLFVGVMVLFALMQYKVKNDRFDYSIWGALIGYTPMFVILIIGQIKGINNMDKKVEEKSKEE